MVGGTRFYERREVKDAVAYLRALANPDDDVNLRRILNVPKRGHRRPGRGDASRRSRSASASRSARRWTALDEIPGMATRSLDRLRRSRD